MIDGLDADVVTLALEGDIDAIAEKSGKIAADWRDAAAEQFRALHLDHRLPRPQGQPEGHQRLGRPGQGRRRGDHAEPEDLGRRALELPRRLGLGQRASSAATRPRSREFVGELYKHVPVLDTGARGSTTTFAQRGIGDVLLAWENEAFLALDEFGADKFEIVVPPISILAEPPVARGRRAMSTRRARARSPRPISNTSTAPGARRSSPSTSTGRPSPTAADPADLQRFPEIKLVTIDDPLFGGWAKAQPKHFADGGIFDQIYKPAQLSQAA